MATTDDYAGNSSTTGRLTTTAPAYGVINFVGDTDWFRIYLSNTTTYVFDQVQTPVNEYYNLDSFLRLYDASGNEVPNASNDDSGGNRNAELTFTPASSNYYYVSAEGNSWSFRGVLTGTYQLSVTEINHAPVVTAKAVSIGLGHAIPVTSLFSASDAEGNASIAYYEFYDSVGLGHFNYTSASTWNPTDHTLVVPADSLSTVSYVPDAAGIGNVRAWATDGSIWSNSANSAVTIGAANHPPTVTSKSASLAVGQSIPVSSLFSASDPDGNATITQYQFLDPSGGGAVNWSSGLGVVWDSANRIATVPASAIGNLTYHGDSAARENVGVKAYDGSLWSNGNNWTYSNVTVTQATLPTKTASEIFKSEGGGIENVGMIRVLADFSKAAYALQSWEDTKINDYSPNSDQAVNAVLAEGWVPLSLSVPHLSATSALPAIPNVGVLTVANGMSGGFYTHGNAAAFVARSADSVVISFRGTNDNASQYSPDQNPYDASNTIKPDVDQWGDASTGQSMQDQYNLFSDLITALDSWVSSNRNVIANVYVTGHSLGGAMAIKYMEDQHPSDPTYKSVTFAAPAFTNTAHKTLNYLNTESFTPGDTRLTQIEISGDPVPGITWDLTTRPGRQIVFTGNQTTDTPDQTAVVLLNNADNHSMDYYRQITKSVDQASWQTILDQPGNSKVLIGASSGPFINTTPVRSDSSHPKATDQYDTYFIVDGSASGYLNTGIVNNVTVSGFGADKLANAALNSTGSIYDGVNVPVSAGNDTLTAGLLSYPNVYYGGAGNDVLNGDIIPELMLGGSGDDTILGYGGNDTLVGGSGNDSLDGGPGIDTAVFSGNLSSYSLYKNSNSENLKDNVGTDGTDTLTNIERLKFANTNLAIDMGVTQHAGESVLLLGAVLGKQALTKSLVGEGINLFDSGYTMQQLSTLIMGLDIWGGLANSGHTTASNTQIANYLLTTVNGYSPDSTTLSNAVFSLNYDLVGTFLARLAVSTANQSQVGLVGLSQTGVEFSPS
jgi:hypothetical protein